MKLLLLILVCWIAGCSPKSKPTSVSFEHSKVLFIDFDMNLEAPEKVSTALQAALKLPIMPFNGFGKMGPAEHKDWYFDFGVGVAEHITIDGKPFEISKSEILNREAKIAYPCKLGAMLELHLLIALRKLDKEGLDASGDHLVEAYRSALDALEKELTLSNVNTTESREPQ